MTAQQPASGTDRAPGAPAGDAGGGGLDRFLGLAIRGERQKQGLTIAQVAERTGLSRGMLSKIENGQASMSLDSLAKIGSSLGISLSALFRKLEINEGGAQHVKAGSGMEVVRRGTRRGHTYHLLAYDQGPRKRFEPFLISMDDASEVFPVFEHPGTEFIYMLGGQLEYRHGQQTYLLEPGDSLCFPGHVPHGPERLVETPIRFLTVIIYGESDAER